MAEFEYSHDKHVLGTDWKSRVRDKEDLKITAYHEAGHTLVSWPLLCQYIVVSVQFTKAYLSYLPTWACKFNNQNY